MDDFNELDTAHLQRALGNTDDGEDYLYCCTFILLSLTNMGCIVGLEICAQGFYVSSGIWSWYFLHTQGTCDLLWFKNSRNHQMF